MHRSLLISCVVLGIAAAGGAYASKPTVAAQTAAGADFSAYKTYNWVSTSAPSGVNPVAFQQAISDVNAAMAQKGYVQADQADLSLVLSAGKENRTAFSTIGYEVVDESDYIVGKLTLDAFDSKTRQAVWHGQATKRIDPDKINQPAVDAAVTSMMAKFPASGAPSQ
jgi:hypothetical protein